MENLALNQAYDLLNSWHDWLKTRKAAEEGEKTAAVLLKACLENLENREIFDPERGIGARLQERQAAGSYDTISMPDEMILGLKKLGALNIDAKVIRALTGKVIEIDADLPKYRTPGAVSYALVELKA